MGNEIRMIGKAKIVIGAKIQDVRTTGYGDVGFLMRGDDALGLVQTGGLDRLDFFIKMRDEGLLHSETYGNENVKDTRH
jgi:hypothetical protein